MEMQHHLKNLADNIVNWIKANDLMTLSKILPYLSVKSVMWIKLNHEMRLKVRGIGYDNDPGTPRTLVTNDEQDSVSYECAFWNPVLFGIYFKRLDIVKFLIENYVKNFVMAIRLPPGETFTEYIKPERYQMEENGKYTYEYYPGDQEIECFGLELSIRNKDPHLFAYLWNYGSVWEDRHFAYVFDKVIEQQWDEGLKILFKAKISHMIYYALPPEERENFLS
jgi:hypothetical protein